MAESQARIGLGSKAFITRDQPDAVKFELAEIKDMNWPSAEADEVDVTHMASPGGFKEFIQGLKDLSTTTLAMNWVPGSPTHTLIMELFASGEKFTLEFLLVGETQGEKFRAFIKGYPRTAPVGEAISAEVTFRIAGIVEE